MDTPVFDRNHYDYELPPELIAQQPLAQRDQCRLLVVPKQGNQLQTKKFSDIVDYLEPGDVLVLNNTKVIKARLFAQRKTGATVEVLLLQECEPGLWEALVKPGKKAPVNEVLYFADNTVEGTIKEKTAQGSRLIAFNLKDIRSVIDFTGNTPLPPYIKRDIDDSQSYQTIYAQHEGAVAAPTAGLHFTNELLEQIKAKGVTIITVTLHCGLATFRPIKAADIRDHDMAAEWIDLSEHAARHINHAKQSCKRIIAVGTTAVRTLESVAQFSGTSGRINPYQGETNLYITPGYQFALVDGLITNFHTPFSSNLVLVASFCGYDRMKASYDYARQNHFRFFSFGDAMLII